MFAVMRPTWRHPYDLAIVALIVGCAMVLGNSPTASAQALLYDNTDHIWSLPHTGPRNIRWVGFSLPGEWYEAQPFHLGGHDNIASVSIPMARHLNATATGMIRFSIWDDNGQGFPGREVASLGVVDIDSLPRVDFSGLCPDQCPESVPSVTFSTAIDDLVPGGTYYVMLDYHDLSNHESGNLLTGLSTTAGANRIASELYGDGFPVPPFEDSDWITAASVFAPNQYLQLSVTTADEPYRTIVCPVGTTYHQDFAFLGPDGQATTFLPQGWAFSDYSRTRDFDGRELTDQERLMRTDTRIFDTSITDAFPVGGSLGAGTPVFNAGAPGDADRALALGVNSTTDDGMFQLVAQVAGGDANSIQLAFDIEAWDAANRRDNPGEAAFNVAFDLDTGDGFAEIIDLGQVTTGAILEASSEDFVNGNEDAYRTSFDSGLLGAHLPEGSLLRVRWMADPEAATQGWVFGLDNVSLGMFAEAVPSILGDYNGNGTVEQGDLDLVLLNWGDDLANPVAAGWTNGAPDGAVDQGELDAVLLNWGNTATTVGAAGVPEPSSLILLAIGLGLMAVGRVRKRR